MKIGALAQELARTNPWWRSPGWSETDRDLRMARDSGLAYRPDSLANLQAGGLYLLRGPRRVGKTVTTKQAIEDLIGAGVTPRSIVRVAADGLEASALRTIVQNVQLPPLPSGTPRRWFIDEITAVSGDWASQIKWLRDNDPDFAAATVVLTGSSAEGLTAASGSLAGRRGQVADVDRTLLPMGFRTFAPYVRAGLPASPGLPLSAVHSRVGREAYDELLPWLDDLVAAWELYLVTGGYPVAVAAAHAGMATPEWFVNDLFAVVFRDAFGQSRLTEATTTTLVARLARSLSTPLNLHAVGADIGVTHESIRSYVRSLRDAYLVWTCPQKADSGWRPRERAQDKLYFIDPLVGRLPHLRNDAWPDIDPAVLTEMQLGLALHRGALRAGAGWARDDVVFYVRTPARKEIDFVSEMLAGAAVEGKYVESGAWRAQAATVEASEWRGILVTRNILDCSPGERGAWAVPAALLAYMVDR